MLSSTVLNGVLALRATGQYIQTAEQEQREQPVPHRELMLKQQMLKWARITEHWLCMGLARSVSFLCGVEDQSFVHAGQCPPPIRAVYPALT